MDELEKSTSEEKQPNVRIAWYRTLLGMTDLGGQVGTEKLARHLGISRSVISEHLIRMEEEGLVKRDLTRPQHRSQDTYGAQTGILFPQK